MTGINTTYYLFILLYVFYLLVLVQKIISSFKAV